MSDVPGRAEQNRALLGLARLMRQGARQPESADRILTALSGAGLDHNRDSVRFGACLERLAPGGALVLTSHYDHEHALALNVMRALGAQCRAVERMPEPRVIGPDGKAVDRYLALFQRDEVS